MRCLVLLLCWQWIPLVSSFLVSSANCSLDVGQVLIFSSWCYADEDIVVVEVTGDPTAAF